MGECQWQTVWAGWEYSCMNGRFLFLKPASRWDSLFSSDLKLISIKTKVYFQMALCNIYWTEHGSLNARRICSFGHFHRFHSSVTPKQVNHIYSAEINARKCLDPRLILVRFSPALIHLLFLLFFRCASLLSSSLYHSFPHFLTPSLLLWPLNVSRWEDTTPIVIHRALSDHCVSALVNSPPPP